METYVRWLISYSGDLYWAHCGNTQSKLNCHKVPKVTSFGFSSLFLSPLSEGRYFRVAKTCIVHGSYEP